MVQHIFHDGDIEVYADFPAGAPLGLAHGLVYALELLGREPLLDVDALLHEPKSMSGAVSVPSWALK